MGSGNGLLGWCQSEKGPQWLFRISKADTDKCRCGAVYVMTGTHVVEESPKLDKWRPRKEEWAEWREALGGRARKKREKEVEEEEADLLEVYFYHIYEFLSPAVTRVPVVTPVGHDDPVVPVNFVHINPIVFVHESSIVSSTVSL